MFKLIKLAAYAALGYVCYEFVSGMFAEYQAGEKQFIQQPRSSHTVPITGGGRGATERTEEASGMSTPHAVGRGVTG